MSRRIDVTIMPTCRHATHRNGPYETKDKKETCLTRATLDKASQVTATVDAVSKPFHKFVFNRHENTLIRVQRAYTQEPQFAKTGFFTAKLQRSLSKEMNVLLRVVSI